MTAVQDDVVESATQPTHPRRLRRLLALVAAVVLVVGGLVVVLLSVGVDPLAVFASMWYSTFGTKRNFGETLVRATPLLLVALTLIPSLRAGLYNLGAPGQLAGGALVATYLALHLGQVPSVVSLVICALAAAVVGALIAAFPGWLKASLNVNEIITTLAMNFIILSVLGWLLNGPFKGGYANLPQSDLVPANAALPVILSGTRAHVGLLLALAFVPLLFALDRSRTGYRLRLFSANPHLARQASVSRTRYIVGLMALGGVGAGLSGWMQVMVIDHRLYTTVAAPVGFAGLFVALLGGLNPFGCIVAAFGLGALLHGGDGLQVGVGLSPEIIQVILGLILLAYACFRAWAATQDNNNISRRSRPWMPWKRS